MTRVALCLLLATGCTSLPRIEWDPAKRPARLDPEVVAEPEAEPERPSFAEVLREGDRMRDTGQVGRAAWKYLSALRLDPSNPLPSERLGLLHLSERDLERAQVTFEGALARDADSVTALCGLGLSFLYRGDFERALPPLERARMLEPTSTLAVLGLGTLHDWKGDHAAAQEVYLDGLTHAPRDAMLQNNLGVSYLLSQDFEAAARHLRRAVELSPDDEAGQNNFGLALGRLGRYDEALRAFRRGRDEATAQNNLGYVYYLNGDPANAIQHFERALAQNPDSKLPIIVNLRRAEDALAQAAERPDPADTDAGAGGISAVAR